MCATDLLRFTLLAKRGHSIDVKDVPRDAELAAHVVHFVTGLMLLDGYDDSFFAVALVHRGMS
jgi:hypothetical protein